MVLGFVNLALSLLSLASTIRSKRQPPKLPVEPSPRPSVNLVVPCCGAEPGLAKNLEALAGQDYPGLRVVFVVESPDDGAVPVIDAVIERFGGELVVAGPAEREGQKVHNLLRALERTRPSDIWAFADSDGRPDSTWLSRLVARLDEPGAGAVSTYRFYVPEPGSSATILRSVWNTSVLSLLGEHDRNFAWGGGTAIYRTVFDEAEVAEAWRGSLSDDYALTHAVRRSGRIVIHEPSCLVPSYGPVGYGELMSWIARQLSITRVYWPRLFWLSAVHHTQYSLFLLLGLWHGSLGRALWLAVVGLGIATGAIRLRRSPWRKWIGSPAWRYAALGPVASLLTVQGSFRALLSRRIAWRGRVYEMRSPTETVIVSER